MQLSGSPWENGYCESFIGKLRDNLLNGEIFMTMKEAEIVIENWRSHYNRRRPHRSLGGRPPAPLTIPLPWEGQWGRSTGAGGILVRGERVQNTAVSEEIKEPAKTLP